MAIQHGAEEIIPPMQLSSPPSQEIASLAQDSNLHIDIDLDTNYLVLVVLDKEHQPLADALQFAQVVRDGLEFNFIGAIDRLRDG